MTLVDNWMLVVTERYAKFDGRAGRAEFWLFYLANFLISLALVAIGLILHWLFTVLLVVYAIAVIVPTIAVSIRRLHDVDKSGWWLLISLIPLGQLVLLFFYIMSGSPHQNRYGDAPEPTA